MGIVDVVSEYCSLPRSRRHMKKRKQFQTVEMKVRIDCEGCERKVKKALDDMKGVSSVEVTPKQNKVTVTGYVDPAKVMRRVAYKTGQAGGAVAVRAVRRGGAPLRPGGLRQARARRLRPQRHERPLRRAARQGLLHRGQVHRRLQRREPQRLLRHVVVIFLRETPAGQVAGGGLLI